MVLAKYCAESKQNIYIIHRAKGNENNAINIICN